MASVFDSESVIEIYLFETSQILSQLEESILLAEREGNYSQDAINLIFRYMHTVKGSSAMMGFTEIGSLSHSMEDLFFYLRENPLVSYDMSALSDIVFEGIDFIKVEIEKIRNKDQVDGNAEALIKKIKAFLCAMMQSALGENKQRVEAELEEVTNSNEVRTEKEAKDLKEVKDLKEDKDIVEVNSEENIEVKIEDTTNNSKELCLDGSKKFHVHLNFIAGAGMESLRLLAVLKNLREIAEKITCIPNETISDEEANTCIVENGAEIEFYTTRDLLEVTAYLQETVFLENLSVNELEEKEEAEITKEPDLGFLESTSLLSDEEQVKNGKPSEQEDNLSLAKKQKEIATKSKSIESKDKTIQNNNNNASNQNFISVNVDKLDKLMDLVGEMVITKAMVVQNPEVNKLEIESFQKAARQLQKITSELQDMVMAIRMVPLSATFSKMNRIVRDMSRKLNRKVNLEVIGEETEVDKNIIEKISDPLMHIIRNSIDHGIEDSAVRQTNGKDPVGTIVLEAKNVGSEVIVSIRDDGQGLNRKKIYQKAKDMGLVYLEMEEMEDRDIYNFILHPGFSTNQEITEFSGRGVGMDVVSKNIESIGGMIFVDSVEGKGMTVNLKIPLTLAIIEGMNIEVGEAKYTVPIGSIRESFQPKEESVIKDPDGNEMIMVRGHIYPIIRLYELYSTPTNVWNYTEGILVMVESDDKTFCLFADRLLGEQQVVLKTLPPYLKRFKKIGGVGGCTLLGDGSISLVLDIGELGSLINE